VYLSLGTDVDHGLLQLPLTGPEAEPSFSLRETQRQKMSHLQGVRTEPAVQSLHLHTRAHAHRHTHTHTHRHTHHTHTHDEEQLASGFPLLPVAKLTHLAQLLSSLNVVPFNVGEETLEFCHEAEVSWIHV